MYRLANSGIMEWYFKERTPRLFGGSEVNLDLFASSRLFLPYPREPEIRLGNVHKTFWLYFSLIIIALIALIYEILKERTKITRLRQKRRRIIWMKKPKQGILRRIHYFIYRTFNRVIVV